MENKAKIRINLDTREFEIEGTEEFVNSHTDKIEGFFGTVKQISASGKASAKAGKASSKRGRKPGVKATPAAAAPAAAKETKAAAPKKAGKRGRPAKAAAKPVAVKEVKAAAPAKAKAGKRGRPAKAAAKPVAAKEVKATAPAAKPVKPAKVAKAKAPKAAKAKKVTKSPSAPKVEVKVTPEFITFFKRVPKDAKDIDKMLAASLFVQNASGGTQFTAKEVNALLVSQGVKLSNAAQYVKNSIKTNRMAQLDRGKFKLTPEGVAHVNSVLTK